MGFSLFSTFFGISTVQLALLGIGIIGFDVAFVDANQLENNHTKGSTADGGNGTEMEIAEFSPQFLKIGGPPPQGINVYYGEEDGLCGWWNGTAYEHSKLEYVNPFSSVQDENEEGMSTREEEKEHKFCLLKFFQAVMQPMCGEQWYSNLKLCAMTQFYQNEEPKPKEGDEKDLMLVLVDGCLVCKSGEAGNVQMALVNEWPAGSTFSNCTKEQRKPDWFDVAMGPDKDKGGIFASQFGGILMPNVKPPTPDEKDKYYSASFTFPLILYQRRCDGIFSADPKADIYTGLKLLAKHSCGGGNGSTMEVNLGDIDPDKFKNNMVELRGMMLILDEGKWLQYRRESTTYWEEGDLKEMGVEGKDQQGKPIYDNAKEKGKKRRRN